MKIKLRRAGAWLVVSAMLLASCSGVKLPDSDGELLNGQDVVRGGLLYDKWWKALKIEEPSGDQPLWSTQSTNTRSGTSTWRCKECHGWDYKGAAGAYATGSHQTGFAGVLKARTKSADELRAALTSGQHDFSAMGDEAIDDVVAFLRAGTMDVAPYIDAESKAIVGGDLDNGEKRYKRTCIGCHGKDGDKINFGGDADPKYIGHVARGNPWEFIHKVRFGQPGTKMPSGILKKWSIEDVRDVTAYSQTLNK